MHHQVALTRLPYCCLALLLSHQVVGQAALGTIAQVQTDAQAEALVRRVSKYYAGFQVSSALTFADKQVEQQYRRAGVKAWMKADFDGDGRPDLLVTGTHYGKSKVVCLLDRDTRPAVEPFRRQFYQACPVATVTYVAGRPIIRYADFNKAALRAGKLRGKQSFRLVYRYGGFVEDAPPSAAPTQPDSIRYESIFAYHSVTTEKLTLDASGRTTYTSCSYPVLDKAHQTTVAERATVAGPTLAELQGLAAYLARLPLKPTYTVGSNHVPHTRLTILYHDGHRLEVEDEGEVGAFALTQLYVLLLQLRKSQSWRPVEP